MCHGAAGNASCQLHDLVGDDLFVAEHQSKTE